MEEVWNAIIPLR